jgi:hypothetical protein
MHQGGQGDTDRHFGSYLANPRAQHGAPCPPGQTRIRYDGNFFAGVSPYLTAKLGAR